MKVLIESEKISMGEHALEYYPYYFAIWRETSDHRLTVKSVLAQWATALSSLKSRGGAVYLPYYLDDQTCKYLKAELDGEDIVLTDMLVRADGYAIDLDDLGHEMYSEPEVVESDVDCNGQLTSSAPRLFGRYQAQELVEALRNAGLAAA